MEQSPPLQGNTWWKGGKSNAELKEMFAREAHEGWTVWGNEVGNGTMAQE